MIGRLQLLLLACVAAAAIGALAVGSTTPTAAAAQRPPRSHVVVLVMENKEDRDLLGSSQAPYLNALARRYGRAVNSFGIRHPSLPNYLALTSGSTQDITTDCSDCHVNVPHIGSQLEAVGRSWKAYIQDLPAMCSNVAFAGAYARKHNPFLYYDNVTGNPARCRRVVGFDALTADLRRNALPDFAWITPNMCQDTHDCPVETGDRFLARYVPSLLQRLGPHGFLIITYDEGSSNAGCCGGDAAGGRIATVVAGPDVRRGARLQAPVDHYGVLRSIEDAFRLPRLGGAARPQSGSLAGLFRRAPRLR